MTKFGRHAALLLCALYASGALAAEPSGAPPPDVPKWVPFSGGGGTGYEEISLSSDSWYVAFQGSRKHAPSLIQAAWAARAAQLCAKEHSSYFVELRYVGEPVLISDPKISRGLQPEARAYPAGGYFVPIIIPNQSIDQTQPLIPNKLAPMRCLSDPAQLRDPKRAIADDDAIAAAKSLGIKVVP
jgi:hypothetical protein